MDVSRATKALDDEFIHWRTRQLKKYVYLILDARYEKVRQGGSVASIFPSAESCERLVTAVLIEISEQWRTEKNKYLPM
jgi:transposase-like protein